MQEKNTLNESIVFLEKSKEKLSLEIQQIIQQKEISNQNYENLIKENSKNFEKEKKDLTNLIRE